MRFARAHRSGIRIMNRERSWRRIEPLLLLLATGAGVGTIFPLGNIAVSQGLSPLVYVAASSLGGTAVLALLTYVNGYALRPDREALRYAFISGQLTVAIPFTVIVVVMQHLGSALPAILQTLIPIATLAIVYAMRLEKPSAGRMFGLGLGVAGAIIILVTREHGDGESGASIVWYLAALAGPAVLAVGNVYRSVAWPSYDPPALQLATWTLAAAALSLIGLLIFWSGGNGTVAEQIFANWKLIALQSLTLGVGYAFYFRLQRVGGPVYISQLSYVNTAVGVLFALALFGEAISLWSWLALALTALGVFTVNATAPRNRLPE